jgi:hypothetical protein
MRLTDEERAMLRTGDRLRIDPAAGIVEIIEREGQGM